jgi:anti-sigma regulatory factor (Ser/Thr protein kinase)
MRRHVSIPVSDASHVGDARRHAVDLARLHGFDEERSGRVAIVVNEMSSNLVKHASGGGEVLVGVACPEGVAALEILALDHGPGMDLGRSLRDGHSTSGSPGTGLGAIARMSDLFDVHSATTGTAVLARISSRTARSCAPTGFPAAGIAVPLPGETECGDAFAVSRFPTATRILLADGLGHGPDAARASDEAARVFLAKNTRTLAELFADLHGALRSTRGAAVGVAEIDAGQEVLRFAGVGNITGVIVGPSVVRRLVSHDGTVGYAMGTIREYAYPFPAGAALVLHSDGLKSSWALDAYPGLALRAPALIAGVLYRDFRRGTDDASVVVCSAAAA